MPPKSLPSTAVTKPNKPYFFYGHRKPTQNRPTVRGGLFTNRQILFRNTNAEASSRSLPPVDLTNWDPELAPTGPNVKDPVEKFFSVAQTLSPIARYILDSFRKHRQWGPLIVADLNKLRRVTPKLVTEVLKVPDIDRNLSTKFFHWADRYKSSRQGREISKYAPFWHFQIQKDLGGDIDIKQLTIALRTDGKQKGYKHDFACYNAFAYCLNRTNQFRAADQVPDLMNMQGKPPSEKQFEILIRMHSDANRGLRVYYVYEKMKKFGVKPRVFLYNRIMDALVKTNHLDLAMSVYKDFKEDGLTEESTTFMILIKGLCKSGQMDEVSQLLGLMRENLCKPDVFAYTAVVKILVGQGNLDGCLRIWKEMEMDGVEPDVMAYGTLVTGLCRGNQVQKAYKLFKEMKEKRYLIDRAIYGSLVEAFIADGKVSSACDLLKDLIESGYRADLAIYNSLIHGLCSVKQVDKAYKLFKVMVQEDLQPDFSTIKPILESFAELKRINDFCRLLGEMQRLGFCVTEDLSKFFSFMVERHERITMTLELFEILKTKNYCNIAMYSILMEALNQIGDVRKALALFHELNNSNIVPDSLSYSIAIQCFVEVGDMQEACKCYNRVKEMSLFPSVAAYCSLVKGLCKIGEIDPAMMLIRDCLANVMNGPVEFKYTLSIIHTCKLNDAQKVIAILNEMMEEGCSLDNLIFSSIISGMCKHGTIEEARKVFSSLREQRLLTEADVIIYDELLIEHMQKKTADLVLSGLKFFGLERKLKAKGSTLISG